MRTARRRANPASQVHINLSSVDLLRQAIQASAARNSPLLSPAPHRVLLCRAPFPSTYTDSTRSLHPYDLAQRATPRSSPLALVTYCCAARTVPFHASLPPPSLRASMLTSGMALPDSFAQTAMDFPLDDADTSTGSETYATARSSFSSSEDEGPNNSRYTPCADLTPPSIHSIALHVPGSFQEGSGEASRSHTPMSVLSTYDVGVIPPPEERSGQSTPRAGQPPSHDDDDAMHEQVCYSTHQHHICHTYHAFLGLF